MPNQAQLSIGDVADAPLTYDVPDAQVIGLVCANAVYDGAGAGGSWLPALELVSDSGHVIARAIPQTSVAAGGSAEVTFGPFLGPPGGGGGTPYNPGAAALGSGFIEGVIIPDLPGSWIPTDLDFGALPDPPPGYFYAVPIVAFQIPF